MKKVRLTKAECQKLLLERRAKLKIDVTQTIYFTKKINKNKV